METIDEDELIKDPNWLEGCKTTCTSPEKSDSSFCDQCMGNYIRITKELQEQ